jgi:hypothetical protein
VHWVSSIYLLPHKPAHRAHKCTLPEAVHSCLGFHVTHDEKDTPWGWHVGAKTCRSRIIINTLTKPSAQCLFCMHNPAMHGTNIKLRRRIFYQQIVLKLKEETNKVLHLEHSFVWCWNFDFWKQIKNTWEVLKCGAGVGYRRSVGPTM